MKEDRSLLGKSVERSNGTLDISASGRRTLLPRREKNWLDPVFEFLFGELAPLARNIFHHMTTYIFIAACIFCARYVVARLFEPTDEVASYLHVIDTYGTLLLLAGFLIWITIDIILLIRKHLGNQHDEDEQDEEDQDRR
jgi:hypothetical protein